MSKTTLTIKRHGQYKTNHMTIKRLIEENLQKVFKCRNENSRFAESLIPN